MKIAIVGSRNITVENIDKYISDVEEIVSGGAIGASKLLSFWSSNRF